METAELAVRCRDLGVVAFDLNLHDLQKLSLNAMKSAFAPFDARLKLIYQVIKPGFAKARSAITV